MLTAHLGLMPFANRIQTLDLSQNLLDWENIKEVTISAAAQPEPLTTTATGLYSHYS